VAYKQSAHATRPVLDLVEFLSAGQFFYQVQRAQILGRPTAAAHPDRECFGDSNSICDSFNGTSSIFLK
jgi:hypothetical protein